MRPRTPTPALLVVALLALPALSGCIGGSSSAEVAGLSSFEDAMAADGKVFEPVEGDGPLRIKLLTPATTSGLEKGEQTVRILVWDDDSGSPLTDATVTLEAIMPAMGHGTSPEEDPAHLDFGVYEGMTTWSMPGGWILNIDVQTADGTSAFDVPVQVGADEPAMDDPAAGKSFASFEEAMDAPGETFDPTEGSSAYVQTESDNVTHVAYESTYGFPVESVDAKAIRVEASLSSGSPADELTLSVQDPDGEELGQTTLSSSSEEGTVEVTDVSADGDYSLVVSGRAAEASYDARITVVYPTPPIKLKLLDPVDPSDADVGKQPIVVLLYDPIEETPITDAQVELSSFMPAMGHGTAEEEDPTHQNDGIYEGKTNHVMSGKWEVSLEVTTSGDTVEFVVPFTASG